MSLSIQNYINGEPITDPDALEEALGLENVGNHLINCNKDFGPEHENDFIRPGILLAMVMLSTKLNEISDQKSLTEFMTRLYVLQSIGRNPLEMQESEKWPSLFNTLSDWIDKGWEYKTNADNIPKKTWLKAIAMNVYDDADRFVEELITQKLTQEDTEDNAP